MRQAYTPACLIFFMIRFFLTSIFFTGFSATLAASAAPQTAAKPSSAEAPSAGLQKALALAETGHCAEALPSLRKSAPLASEKNLKLKAGLAAVRCALAVNQMDAALNALAWLNRDFPSDPQVLYVTTHAFSDLSTRAALQLANRAPNSFEAHELDAEALESQGKWDDAAAEYREILKRQPDLPGIHYRLGRIILSRPPTPSTPEDARAEFQAELKNDPKNAGAEYVLGELARQTEQWDDAIQHFSRASALDAHFANAFLGLGFCLNSAGRFAEATPPLETEVKLQPDNPTGHYQLALAYGKTGRKQDAEREMVLFQQASEKMSKERHDAAPPPQP
jgi:predicted Zn-dependent protease